MIQKNTCISRNSLDIVIIYKVEDDCDGGEQEILENKLVPLDMQDFVNVVLTIKRSSLM